MKFGVSASLLILLLVSAVACHRDAEQSLTRAVEAWDSGDYKLAAEEYERYLYQRPTGDKSLEARFQLANIYYFKLKRYDQARIQYTALLEQNAGHPNASLARERLAEVLGEMGRSYEAIAEYENLNPQDSAQRRRIRLRIADLYFAQRNYSQALTEYEKVIESVPYDELSEQAYLREASIYHLERGQYQLALPVYQKLSSMSGDRKVRIRALYGLVDCYGSLYQFDEAIKTLRTIKDDSERAEVTHRLADLEQQKREAAQATGAFPATVKASDRSKSSGIQASKSEAEQKQSDQTKASKPGKAGNSQDESSNGANRSRTQATRKVRADNSNEAANRSSRPHNAKGENSNAPQRVKSKKAANANQ